MILRAALGLIIGGGAGYLLHLLAKPMGGG